MAQIKSIKIHPSIGVARIGNHPTEYYIGPERPNQFIGEQEIGGFKANHEGKLKIKKQGARFRVFGYYDDNSIVELTDSVEITWRVRIANTKGRSRGFYSISAPPDPLRNAFVPEPFRKALGLEPPEISIQGNDKSVAVDKVKFGVRDTNGTDLTSGEISLGECKTDEKGRLIVLGGKGDSGTVKDWPLGAYDDNDYWYDDIADGFVKASVKFKDSGVTMNAADAWVVCVPPKFVPGMHPVVTMYDVLTNRHVIESTLQEVARPLFFRDIHPIIKRALNVRWVHKMAAHNSLQLLLSPASPPALRKRLFDKLRKPDNTGGNMPRIFGDRYNENRTGRLSLTSVQYKIMKKWLNSEFDVDTQESTNPTDVTALGLDQAALENCVGGGFYPGIEMSWFVRDQYKFSENYRLDTSQLLPGDISKQMALPWQADFWACSKEEDGLTPEPSDMIGWWPYSRPDDVFDETGTSQREWTPRNKFPDYASMVTHWAELGFILERDGKYVEVQRTI